MGSTRHRIETKSIGSVSPIAPRPLKLNDADTCKQFHYIGKIMIQSPDHSVPESTRHENPGISFGLHLSNHQAKYFAHKLERSYANDHVGKLAGRT